MLDAIPTTPAPRGASPAKAGQKPEDAPDEARFQQVYGKGEKPQGKPQDEAGERSTTAEAPAARPTPPLDPAALPMQPPTDAELVAATDEPPPPDQPDPDAPVTAASLPVASAPIARPQDHTMRLPEPTQATEAPPEGDAADPAMQSTASPVEPPAPDAAEAAIRTVAPTEALAVQVPGRAEHMGGGRETEPRASIDAPRSTEETGRAAAPRAEPAVAPSPHATEVAAPRAVEVAVAAPAAADSAPIAPAQATQQTPALQPLQSAPPVAQPPAAVIEQLVVAAKQNSDGRIDLTLSPAELGRVRMTLLAGETGITVAIHADRDDTLDLFRRNSDTLAQEFRQLGYGSVGFEFRGGGKSGQTHQPADDVAENAVAENTPALPVGILRLTGIGGLDIRL